MILCTTRRTVTPLVMSTTTIKAAMAAALLVLSSSAFADAKITFKKNQIPKLAVISDGPLPGTVISMVSMTSRDPVTGNDGNVTGYCVALVMKETVQRDLEKQPLKPQEILGFTCNTVNYN